MGFKVLDDIGKGFFAFRTVEGERREADALAVVFVFEFGFGFGFGGWCG